MGFVVCLFVCFFSCLSSREHNLSQTGISWVVVSFSCKPVLLSFPFPLGKSLFQLPFHALPPALPVTPAFAHSILYQRRGKHSTVFLSSPRCCFVLSLTLTKARCSRGRAQLRSVPWQRRGLCSTMALEGGSAPATVAPGTGAGAVAGLGCPRGNKN